MRIVVAACSVDYQGRLSAHLPEAKRLLVVKADGSVLVHDDAGGYKPLNWMACPCSLADHGDHWEVTNRKGERLTITFSEVVLDEAVDLGESAALAKDGVEAHLQKLLAANPHEVEPGLVLVRREHATPIGPVDLLCRDPDGGWVVIEVKRRGEVDGVEQLGRYLELLTVDARLSPLRGVLAAQKVAPQARTLAELRGLRWVELDYDRLRGLGSGDLTLF
ncbi:MAG: endonuclease NucS [Actinomycetota bacterium]|jgi:endonuclease|nr:endonuclease NucS [Actinomycetota bacterium]